MTKYPPPHQKNWTVFFSHEASKDLRKLDKPTEIKISEFIKKKLIDSDDPRIFGKRLSGSLNQFWSYRIGNYRIIASIEASTLIIIVVRIGHRREVYEINH